MRASGFLDTLLDTRGADTEQLLQDLAAMTSVEQVEIRDETLRRLFDGEIFFPVALMVLPRIGLEPVIPELVRLLRTRDALVASRAAAFMLLRQTDTDVWRELQSLDEEGRVEVLAEVDSFERAVLLAAQSI